MHLQHLRILLIMVVTLDLLSGPCLPFDRHDFIVHWCIPMQFTLVVSQDIPLRDVRRNKLQYLVHFSDQVKVL